MDGSGATGIRELKQADLLEQASQELATQRGHSEVDVGERHIISVGPQIVNAVSEPIPVVGQAKAGVGMPASGCRIGSVGAMGSGQQRPAVDTHLYLVCGADPAPNQADPADRRPLRGRF